MVSLNRDRQKHPAIFLLQPGLADITFELPRSFVFRVVIRFSNRLADHANVAANLYRYDPLFVAFHVVSRIDPVFDLGYRGFLVEHFATNGPAIKIFVKKPLILFPAVPVLRCGQRQFSRGLQKLGLRFRILFLGIGLARLSRHLGRH